MFFSPKSLKTYSVHEAEEIIFRQFLRYLAGYDLFCKPDEPTAFIVYAHDNENNGIANATSVKLLIKWFKVIRARVYSDKNLDLTHAPRPTADQSIRDILCNQFCLLPQSAAPRSNVEKVILCGSQTLEAYCESRFACEYRGAIHTTYRQARAENLDEEALQRRIGNTIRSWNNQSEFHHVLTELAFLEIRSSEENGNKSIIPVALNGNNEGLIKYLPFLEPTNLALKLDPKKGLPLLFFKLLQQISPRNVTLIDGYMSCYTEASQECGRVKLTEKNIRLIMAKYTWQAHASFIKDQAALYRSLTSLDSRLTPPLECNGLQVNPKPASATSISTSSTSRESSDGRRRSPLYQEAKCAKRLLRQGISDIADNNGQTPLIQAARNGHMTIVEHLLNNNSDRYARDNDGRSALSYAAGQGHNEVVRQMLFDFGETVDLPDNKGRTALSWAAEMGHPISVDYLLEAGSVPDATDNEGRTPLSFSAENGHTKNVELLLEAGSDRDATDNQGRNALFWAAQKGHNNVVKLLSRNGAEDVLKT